MRQTKIVELVILGLWLTLAVTYFAKTRYQEKDVPVPHESVVRESGSLKSGAEYSVRRIAVLDGSTYDILLKDDDGTRVLCELDVKATSDAKSKVLDLLNASRQPLVKLVKRQETGRWLVDLSVTEDGKNLNLSSWLRENKLVYR